MLDDSHKIMRSVTKFRIRMKKTDRSHKCTADTNEKKESYKGRKCQIALHDLW